MSRYDKADNLSGAEYLASIYGTEKDKVNCSFYFKVIIFYKIFLKQVFRLEHAGTVINALERIINQRFPIRFCWRIFTTIRWSTFVKLTHSIVSVFCKFFFVIICLGVGKKNEDEQKYFDDFYEEVFVELERKYGPVEELNVCENIGEHMVGNVYVKFLREEDAEKAVHDLENRW